MFENLFNFYYGFNLEQSHINENRSTTCRRRSLKAREKKVCPLRSIDTMCHAPIDNIGIMIMIKLYAPDGNHFTYGRLRGVSAHTLAVST